MIVFISAAPFLGGAEYQTLDLISGLKNHFKVKLVCDPKSALKVEAEKLGLEVETLKLGSTLGKFRGLNYFNPLNFFLGKELEKKLSNLSEKDLVVSFDYKELILLRGIEGKFQHLHIQHPEFPSWLRKNPFVKKAVLDSLRACKSLVVDCFALKTYLAAFGLDQEKIRVVYNGVDEKFFLPPGQEQKREGKRKLGLSEKKVIGINARVNAGKGYETLLEAFKIIKKEFPEAHLLSVGGGNKFMEKRVKSKAKALGLDSEVTFLGKIGRAEILDFYYALDLFTLPSESEGLPLSVLEAMFTKTPVVATKVGGIPEEIEDSKSGWLVEPKNSQLLAQALIEALQDRAKREALAEQAYKVALEKFTKSHMIEESKKIIRKALGEEVREN